MVSISLQVQSIDQDFQTLYICYYVAKCEDPALQIVDSQVEVVDFHMPALEGTNITLGCPSGRVLTGHNSTSATCMRNGN